LKEKFDDDALCEAVNFSDLMHKIHAMKSTAMSANISLFTKYFIAKAQQFLQSVP
jgi:hypothetical protein